MTPRAKPRSRPETAPPGQTIQLLAILLWGATCCTTALGATTACDRTTDLQSLEVPVSELSASVVGHIAAEPDEENDSLMILPAQGNSTVPILNLAPRVAVILQDVFSAVAIDTAPLVSHDPIESITIDQMLQNKSPMSPVAGDAGRADSSELSETEAAIEEADAVPSVQRKMFRTDI